MTAPQDRDGPGGREFRLEHSGYQAVVTEVGATLRELRRQDRDLVVPFARDEIRPLYRGAVVAPWPNRIADGRYRWAGETRQLPINEVDRHTALHGLVIWERWSEVSAAPDRVELEHRLVPQPGYPYALVLRIVYELTGYGLRATLSATNLGTEPAPYGCCPHPYLTAGPGTVDGWTLELPAATRLEVDPERLLPIGTADVVGVDCDFRSGALIGPRQIDHAFTDLTPGPDGRITVRLRAGGGPGVQLSWGPWAGWVQVHTADRPEPENNRIGLAVEPMNIPPDGFNAPAGPTVLAAGETHTAEWTIGSLD